MQNFITNIQNSVKTFLSSPYDPVLGSLILLAVAAIVGLIAYKLWKKLPEDDRKLF